MTRREEIMHSTPEQLAANYSFEELSAELEDYAGEFDVGSYMNQVSYTECSGETVTQEMIDGCESDLVELFDECGQERIITAEDLAIACHLWAAMWYAYDREKTESED